MKLNIHTIDCRMANMILIVIKCDSTRKVNEGRGGGGAHRWGQKLNQLNAYSAPGVAQPARARAGARGIRAESRGEEEKGVGMTLLLSLFFSFHPGRAVSHRPSCGNYCMYRRR